MGMSVGALWRVTWQSQKFILDIFYTVRVDIVLEPAQEQ